MNSLATFRRYAGLYGALWRNSVTRELQFKLNFVLWIVVELLWFALQLCLNAAWSWLFFEWRSGWLAFADIVLLVVLVVGTVWAFWRAKPLAGVLLLPYLGWVLFATALTWVAWRGNPGLLS